MPEAAEPTPTGIHGWLTRLTKATPTQVITGLFLLLCYGLVVSERDGRAALHRQWDVERATLGAQIEAEREERREERRSRDQEIRMLTDAIDRLARLVEGRKLVRHAPVNDHGAAVSAAADADDEGGLGDRDGRVEDEHDRGRIGSEATIDEFPWPVPGQTPRGRHPDRPTDIE